MLKSPLLVSTLVFTALQIAMVVLGHFVVPVRDYYALGGTSLSVIQGFAYGWFERGAWLVTSGYGGLFAGVAAFVGVAIYAAMGDAPASLLMVGSLASAVAGVIGTGLGRVFHAVFGKTIPEV